MFIAVLHCTAFLGTAPLNVTGCKIKDIIMSCTFGVTVKVHDMPLKLRVSFLIRLSCGLSHCHESQVYLIYFTVTYHHIFCLKR